MELIAFKKILKNEYRDPLIDQEIALLTPKQKQKYPVIAGYVLAYHMFMNDDPTDTTQMDAFRDFLLDYEVHEKMPMADFLRLYNFLLNYSIGRINQEILGARKYHYDLTRIGVTRGHLQENGQLPPWTFKNIVTNALQVGGEARTWLEQTFIPRHSPFVHEDYREAMLIYCNALILFYDKKLSKAVRELNQLSLRDDYFLSTDNRILLLKIRLLQNDPEGVESTAKAFDAYLNRNQEMADHRKNSYLLQNRYFRKCAKLKSQKKAEELMGQLKAEDNFANRKWLIKELHGLIESGKLEE